MRIAVVHFGYCPKKGRERNNIEITSATTIALPTITFEKFSPDTAQLSLCQNAGMVEGSEYFKLRVEQNEKSSSMQVNCDNGDKKIHNLSQIMFSIMYIFLDNDCIYYIK